MTTAQRAVGMDLRYRPDGSVRSDEEVEVIQIYLELKPLTAQLAQLGHDPEVWSKVCALDARKDEILRASGLK